MRTPTVDVSDKYSVPIVMSRSLFAYLFTWINCQDLIVKKSMGAISQGEKCPHARKTDYLLIYSCPVIAEPRIKCSHVRQFNIFSREPYETFLLEILEMPTDYFPCRPQFVGQFPMRCLDTIKF